MFENKFRTINLFCFKMDNDQTLFRLVLTFNFPLMYVNDLQENVFITLSNGFEWYKDYYRGFV